MPDPLRPARLRFALDLVRARFGRTDWADLGLLIAAAGGRSSPVPAEIVRRWARGDAAPGLDALESICRLLDSDLDPAWLAWGRVGAEALAFDGWACADDGAASGPAPCPDEPRLVRVPLPAIRAAFARCFEPSGILLPLSALVERARGGLAHEGWGIQFLFREDAGGEYLDLYATHPMTHDRHVRIHETGRTARLATPCPLRVIPAGAAPAEIAARERAHAGWNRRVAQELAEKGFGGGDPAGGESARNGGDAAGG
jgi:hypothetical protein